MSDEQRNLKSVRSIGGTSTKRVIRTYASDFAALKKNGAEGGGEKIKVPTNKVSEQLPTPPPKKSKEKPEIPVNLVVMRKEPAKTYLSIWERFLSFFVSKKKNEVRDERVLTINENIVVHEKKDVSPYENELPSTPVRPSAPPAQVQRQTEQQRPAIIPPQQQAPPIQTQPVQKPIVQPPQKSFTINIAGPDVSTVEILPQEQQPVAQQIPTVSPQKPEVLSPVARVKKQQAQKPTGWQIPTLPLQEQQSVTQQIPIASSQVQSANEQPVQKPIVQPPQKSSTINVAGSDVSTVEISQPDITKFTQFIPKQNVEVREDILARLREKVSKGKKENELLVEKSVLPPRREDMLPSQREKSKTTFTPPPFTPPSTNIPSPIHTYKTDFSNHIKETHASTTSILSADQNYEQTNEAGTTRRSYTPLFFTIGAVLLVGGVAGIFYAYYHNIQLSAPVATTQTAPSLIATDKAQEISSNGTTLMNALSHAAANAQLPDESIMLTYITIATTTAHGATTTIPVPGGYLIARLNLSMPRILVNNIAVDSTVGIIHAGTQTRPFFLLHVASYDAAFAGMLRWEHNMPQDLAQIYPPYKIVQTETASSTLNIPATQASSTPSGNIVQASPNISPQKISLSFTDEVIANHDVRILRNAVGQSIMLYGFKNKSTLIIARDPAAFIEILNRINNVSAQ